MNPEAQRAQDPVVELQGVSRHFGEVRAVREATFAVRGGEFVTLLGPSGSGKSTILMMIAGFLDPTAGEIFIEGQPVSARAPHERNIGMVFQSLALFPHMDVFHNIAFALKMRRVPPRHMFHQVEEMLKVVRLEGLGGRKIHHLSGGQRQRVALARALVFEPSLLLLDEPLGALDKKLREDMQLELRRIQHQLGVTTINVTHDQKEALIMSDRIVVMNHGSIEQIGTPNEIYAHPRTRFVADFIGNTNLFQAKVSETGPSGQGTCQVRAGTKGLKGVSRDPIVLDQTVSVAIRAERIHLVPSSSEANRWENQLEATLQDVLFEGDRWIYAMEPSDADIGSLCVSRPAYEAASPFRIGEPIWLGWSREDTMVLSR